jgi:RND family efflux transporter MFP subunit
MAATVIVVAATGIFVRVNHANNLSKEVENQHETVKVLLPELGAGEQSLVLPGNVRADLDAPIYARVSGYLKGWRTDIGAHVKKGQVLAEIETPELDQQILRAKADVASAESNWEIADVTAKRYQNLLATDSVSHQEADEKAANAKGRRDILNAARANLQSLLAEQSFQRIVAPFDGVVTERNTDIGKLIASGSSNGQPLFRVVDSRKLRIYVEAPQSYAHLIVPGMTVQVTFPEFPSEQFAATVVGASNAIRESSRTSTVEILMNNKGGRLFSGSYAEVHFNLRSQGSVLRLPVSALLFRADGLQVATVGADGRVVMKTITIANDLGRTVEVGSGITASDRVIDSPSDSISQGDVVRIRKPDNTPATAPKSENHS